MFIVKCNKCGEQLTAANFQEGDTLKCPNCGNPHVLRSYEWDTKIGASRSQYKNMIWAIGLLFYSTIIVYIVAATSFKIYNKEFTWFVAIFWIVCPVCVYFSVKEKQEERERKQAEIERKKDFDREMRGR